MADKHTTVSVDVLSSHHGYKRWMTPLVHQQPVQYMKHMADCVAGQPFTCHHYSVLECYFIRIIIGKMVKFNAKHDTRALPAAATNICLFH